MAITIDISSILESADGIRYSAYRAGDAPVGGGSLLSLDIANAGNAAYKYWNVNSADDTYAGAFRLPSGNHSGANDDFNYARLYPSIALNGSNKMFVAGKNVSSYNAGIAEVNIPALSTSTSLASLNTATISQNFYDPFGNAPSNSGEWGVNGEAINGMCVVNNRLVVNYYAKYDTADGGLCPDNSIVFDGTTLNGTGLRGFFTGTDVAHYTGWISEVPVSRQSSLGGTFIYGNSSGNSRSINNRNSIGPSLFAMDFDVASSITGATPPANGAAISPTPIAKMDFDLTNPIVPVANLNDAGTSWTNLSECYFGFIVPGTRTYMVFGESGGHSSGVSYGTPAWKQNQGYYPVVQSDVDNHYWLFDLNDITGATNPYDPQPYEHGRIAVKFEGTKLDQQLRTVRGGSYDAVNGILYLSVSYADDQSGDETNYPLIVAYDISEVLA